MATTMKEKTGTRNERRRNPGNQNGCLKTNHPSQMQSSSIAYGTILSGIGGVKSPKGTAEENGGHISQRIAQTTRNHKRQKPRHPMETSAKQTHLRSTQHIRQLFKPRSLHARTCSSKNKTQVLNPNDRDGEDG